MQAENTMKCFHFLSLSLQCSVTESVRC